MRLIGYSTGAIAPGDIPRALAALPPHVRAAEEGPLAEALTAFLPLGYPVVLHPDTIHDFSLWTRFGRGIAVENMDRRKARGRTADELRSVFDHLPEASFCFDVGHAHQVDRTMTDAWLLLRELGDRLIQVHASEVSTRGRHDPLSRPALRAFRRVAEGIPPGVPILVESPGGPAGPEAQMALARDALDRGSAPRPRALDSW
jgi:hypothetical protein